MVLIKSFLLSGLVAAAAAKSAVLDLIPSNFDSVALAGKPALVEFFAPWCGHCKTLAPVYEELGAAFSHASDKLSIAKVDADANKSLGKRFGIQGFPTIKYFDGKSEKPVDYNGGRDLESLTKFVSEKTGVKARGAGKGKPSDVVMLTDSTFAETIGKDKDVLVAFTAPWCGRESILPADTPKEELTQHTDCKTLGPVWETVATDFAYDENVVIAKVDAEADNSKATSKAQAVASYPTIKFFPRGSTEGVAYSGGRTEAAILAYINKAAGTHRVAGGGLDANAGVLEAFDELIAKYQSGSSIVEIAAEAGKVALAIKDEAQRKYAEYYVKVFSKLTTSKDFVTKEAKRLEGMMKKGGLAQAKLDEFTRKLNVLRRFIGQPAAQVHEEL